MEKNVTIAPITSIAAAPLLPFAASLQMAAGGECSHKRSSACVERRLENCRLQQGNGGKVCYKREPGRLPRPEKEDSPAPVRTYHVCRNNNTSGCAGVAKRDKRWKAEISLHGVRYRLGVYDAFEEAVAVRREAEDLVLAGDIKQIEEMSVSASVY